MSGSILKIIAAVTMFIDHAGVILFPQYGWMRIIGRIAFPLYAYCITEGFRHTGNRMKYFLRIFLLGLACQIVYTIVEKTLYLGILLTFSLSILLMAAADEVVKSAAAQRTHLDNIFEKYLQKPLTPTTSRLVNGILFFSLLMGILLLTHIVKVDYGFFGVILPVLAFFPQKSWGRKSLFVLGMLVLALEQYIGGSFTVQFWSVLAIPLLLAYNEKPGKYRMKWFFYIFYPAHMVFLYILSFLLP